MAWSSNKGPAFNFKETRVNIFRKAAPLATFLMASGICHAAGWTGDLTVVSAFTEGTTDMLVIETTDGSTFTSGCIANHWVLTSDSDPRRARAYATILAALTTGQKLRFWFTDTCGAWSYHQATSVMLLK